MQTMLTLGVLSAVLTVTIAWPKYYDNNFAWEPARRSLCVGSGGKCYASGQCCKGHVCAAFDDLFGLNPEIPGFCVREKDLSPCGSDGDCDSLSKCVRLGHGKGRFCVSKPVEMLAEEPAEQNYVKEKAGLGDPCKDNSECAPYTADGKDRLCCQEVRRYRQRAKKICDRVTPISVCINERK